MRCLATRWARWSVASSVERGRLARHHPTSQLTDEVLAGSARSVGALDEVDRGALAGPVAVGLVVLNHDSPDPPVGIADSKVLTAARREALVPAISTWVRSAVGLATAAEVDLHGILGALRLAAWRALRSHEELPELLVVDGNVDWVNWPTSMLLEEDLAQLKPAPVAVRTEVRGDQTSVALGAASIVAKVHRDALMVGLDQQWPGYGWATNKGYGTPAHLNAIAERGLTPEHRQSWKL